MRTHSLSMGYFLWLTLGLLGVHRFYFGKRITGVLYMFTLGFAGIGWLVDLFLLPSMRRSMLRSYQAGVYSYASGWLLLLVFGIFGAHRYYAGRWKSGLLYTFTLGCLGVGVLYDLTHYNELLSEENERWISGGHDPAHTSAPALG